MLLTAPEQTDSRHHQLQQLYHTHVYTQFRRSTYIYITCDNSSEIFRGLKRCCRFPLFGNLRKTKEKQVLINNELCFLIKSVNEPVPMEKKKPQLVPEWKISTESSHKQNKKLELASLFVRVESDRRTH